MARFQRHLFSCLNSRSPDDPRGSCTARGGEHLADVAREEVHRLGLKGKVRANKAGCLDACAHGPVCVVYPEGSWYAPRTDEDMREIVASHLRDGVPVQRLLIPAYHPVAPPVADPTAPGRSGDPAASGPATDGLDPGK